jgi:hypothetical protein
MAEVSYAELDIGLFSIFGVSDRYRVQVRYWPLDSDAMDPAVTGEARLDPNEFNEPEPDAYGRRLAERLFASPAVRERFLLARQATYNLNQNPTGLRVRLWFDAGAERLYDLRWETLCEPRSDDAPDRQVVLSTQDLVPFSRFLGSFGNRRIRLRPKSDLRILVVIASPPVEEDLDDGRRARAVVNVNAEWARVQTALQGLPPPILLARHADAAGPPTRPRLLDELNTGYDVVHVVCHGALDRDGPHLSLETDQGDMDSTPGSVLVGALEGLPQPPRLVSLTACQSAGPGRSTDNKAHLALAPDLVRSGVPAVLAMNGKVSQLTAAEFYTRFFVELQKHGGVDRAMSTARRTVKNLPRSDWWMPVLYMRLAAGRLWSVMHLMDREEPYEELSLSLQTKRCTPIVGPALLDSLWGSARDVARDWAERRGFPLAPHGSAELPTVAQYLACRRTGGANRAFVVDVWLNTMEALLRKKWPDLAESIASAPDVADTPGGLDGLSPARRVARLASAAGARLREDPHDPYRLLARFPVSTYLIATPDPLMADALRAATPPRLPVVEYARWTEPLQRKGRDFDDTDKRRAVPPTVDKPLVYHLFGTLEEPDSLVLTEDDFFDYLICVVKDTNSSAIPLHVRDAWSANALMLLGFDLDDWTFRVLYRAIAQESGHLLRQRKGPLSAAVQLNPEEERNLRPDLALRYLEQVFNIQRISLSWSQPKDFLREVWKQLPAAFGGPP